MKSCAEEHLRAIQRELPQDVPAAWLDRLVALLELLDGAEAAAGRSPLGRDILNYLLFGASASLLAEVAPRKELAVFLGLLGGSFRHEHIQTALAIYEGYAALPPALALRWAKFIDACTVAHRPPNSLQLPAPAQWLEILLKHSHGCALDDSQSSARQDAPGAPCAAYFEAMLREAGVDPAALAVASLSPNAPGAKGAVARRLLSGLEGFGDMLARNIGAIAVLVGPGEAWQQMNVLSALEFAPPQTLRDLAAQLCSLATSADKEVRRAAEVLLGHSEDEVFTPLQNIARNAKADQRLCALRLLDYLGTVHRREAWVAAARHIAAADKAPAVKAQAREWAADDALLARLPAQLPYVLPAIDWSAAANPLPPALPAKFQSELNAAIEAHNTDESAAYAAAVAQGNTWHNKPELIAALDGESFAFLERSLTSDGPPAVSPFPHLRATSPFRRMLGTALPKLAAAEQISPVLLFKLLAFFGLMDDAIACACFNAMHRAQARPSLLELSEILAGAGMRPVKVLHMFCRHEHRLAADWPDADRWPYFAHHIDLLVEDLLKCGGHAGSGPFDAARTFPQQPRALVKALCQIALADAKAERRAAQDALIPCLGLAARIGATLAAGKTELRISAAQWLGRLGGAEAIPVLTQAAAAEPDAVVKSALQNVLDALGSTAPPALDEQAILAEARDALGADLFTDLASFPWEALPTLRWAGDGSLVPLPVVRWLMVLAVRSKSPEPDSPLRRRCALFAEPDREKFGQFVLEVWLNKEGALWEEGACAARAAGNARFAQQIMREHPAQFHGHPFSALTTEQLTEKLLPLVQRDAFTTILDSKGLLAVAACCCGRAAVALVRSFLDEFYGQRPPHCKALLAMLASMDHAAATDLLVSVSRRFRTEGIRVEAARLTEQLAKRRGWTITELADRSVPTAGFDATGAMQLSYGSRSFSVRLQRSFKTIIFSPEGKKVAALTEPRQGDDPAAVRAARLALETTQQEIKLIVAEHTDRLYDALCAQRRWRYSEWERCLNTHPVLQRLTQRLVWVELEGDRLVQVFRPLSDRSLSDANENQITLSADAEVCLAHDLLLDDAQIATWRRHLLDYEIDVLFPQLGNGRYAARAEHAEVREILDYADRRVPLAALRQHARKLGYESDRPKQGGATRYYKRLFPRLAVTAILTTKPDAAAEAAQQATLGGLSFEATDSALGRGTRLLPLTDVPPVLLAEVYRHLQLFAQDGKLGQAD
ncbi:MAG: DUF4132 domain-containing protein [Rhodocyclaceae bacterium]|nr:DUF4132 domain-containing protein [Rhodocyclaceae bacterium]